MNLNEMKKIVYFIMFWLCSLQMVAQEQPYLSVDYSMLEKVTTDKNSEYYYPDLKARFIALDTTLTEKHLFHLYYGTILQKDFDVFDTNGFDVEVRNILEKEEITKEEWRVVVSKLEETIAKNPFIDLYIYDYLYYGYEQLGDLNKSLKYSDLHSKLLGAILSTGDGETIDTAIDVIQTSHEFYFFAALGIELLESELISNEKAQKFDLLRFNFEGNTKVTEDSPIGMYFDVTKIFELYNGLMFKEVNFDE